MLFIQSSSEEARSFIRDVSEATGQQVFQRETEKETAKNKPLTLWHLNKPQIVTSKTTPLKIPEYNWISSYSNLW